MSCAATELPRLYVISNLRQAESAGDSLRERLLGIAEAGAEFLQLRDKDLSARRRTELADSLVRSSPERTKIAVNGRADITEVVGADALHNPGDGLPIADLRRTILTDSTLVGVSTHSLDELRRAQTTGADFATLSPIFRSDSKPGYGPAFGTDILSEVREVISIPVFALSGITPRRAEKCIEAGADGVAVMGGLMRAANPRDKTTAYLEAIHRAAK